MPSYLKRLFNFLSFFVVFLIYRHFSAAVAPPMQIATPPLMHHQQPQPQPQPFMHPQANFAHQEFQQPTNIPPGPTTVHLESPNRLAPGPTILMAPHHDSPLRVGLPVQMIPPGAQFIQVQQHPHGQVVQRFASKFFIFIENEYFYFIQNRSSFS